MHTIILDPAKRFTECSIAQSFNHTHAEIDQRRLVVSGHDLEVHVDDVSRQQFSRIVGIEVSDAFSRWQAAVTNTVVIKTSSRGVLHAITASLLLIAL